MKKAFILCGLTGWCMEILWTGLHSILSGELTMTGKTSLLMFPIYGCGAIIRPLSGKLSAVPLFVRGCIYTVGFFFVEFISGVRIYQGVSQYRWPSQEEYLTHQQTDPADSLSVSFHTSIFYWFRNFYLILHNII